MAAQRWKCRTTGCQRRTRSVERVCAEHRPAPDVALVHDRVVIGGVVVLTPDAAIAVADALVDLVEGIGDE